MAVGHGGEASADPARTFAAGGRGEEAQRSVFVGQGMVQSFQ